MQFEVIRKSHKKEIIIGISLLIILGVVLIVRFTFAKYELVKSIKIAEGTINYKVPDFKIMAMYKNDGNGDIEIDTMPESGYAINEIKSYCTLDNVNKDNNAKIFTNADGNHVISGLSKYDKCYLYFDKKLSAGETILANVTLNEETPDFSKVADIDEGLYNAEDDDGISYYFRGAVTTNYVRFGKNKNGQDMYWRIIRINGDETIRLIYDGTELHANGEVTTDSIAVTNVKWSHKDAYISGTTGNQYVKDNVYVGFKYTLNQVHGLGTKSNALTQLETWYEDNLASYANKIDTNAGFCGDRTPSTSTSSINNSGGTGTTVTYYGGYIRLYKNKLPILTCENTSDLYTVSSSNKGNKSLTYPVGLITADEVAMAGGVYGVNNAKYYLYNAQEYWTMTPLYYNSLIYALMLRSASYGGPNESSVGFEFGLRPVINLRADIAFLSGNGTMANPYIVE